MANQMRIALGAASVLSIAFLWWKMRSPSPILLRGAGDTLTIAATGDSLIVKPLPSLRSDAGLHAVENLLQSSSLAVTNLEQNLLDPRNLPAGLDPQETRWPFGTKSTAQDLRRMGFSIISLANNHAIDYGVDGLNRTAHIIDSVGLLHAGTGADLEQARASVFIGSPGRRVGLVAVAISASPESRATPTRGEILGRPGVNALRYSPDVTVDAKTFATLKQSPVVTASADTTSSELTMSGKVIRKGEQTSVNMVADVEDMREILEQVRHARARADVVIVTAHSHEPSNRSTAPAEFFRNFARAAVDAGAGLVIGQGPHQLRGIEIYHSGIIFYSLGNFMFDFSVVDPRSEDPFEAGTDLYRVALGAVADSDAPPQQSVDNPVWWESVIAIVHFEHGVLQSVRLQPIDLGVDLPAGQRGVPRLASANRGHEILKRLADLSREFGARIRIEDGAGVIDRE